jgi:hypothetical protein
VAKALYECILGWCLTACCFGQIYYPNQAGRINDLPMLTAKSESASAVLATSVEIILHERKVCCGKGSALEDSVQSADPKSLKDVANQLQGRHLLSDGRPILVNAEYLAGASVNPDQLINTLMQKQPLLMQWNSHFYVVYGVVYDQTVNQDSGIVNAIHKFLLIDPRYSDARREVVFDRLKDDWGKVQGLVILKVASQ